ncbi:MAG: exodeoxyribonuclease VII large subunit, partial [Deltaproteobacteria bacterium]
MPEIPQPDLFTWTRKPPPRRVYTVGELTRAIKRLLEGTFESVWVEGEISRVSRPRSGHLYFSLKDDDAVLPAVLFRGQAKRVRFAPEEGMAVLARGRVNVYEPRGQYQLIVEALEPQGLGALQAAFEQLRERLRKEGLFDAAHKQPLPRLPRCVGVVTSPSGAAIRDFLDVLGRRNPTVSVLVAPARVQGEGAAEEVARQIRVLDRLGTSDVIVVTRGGGSLEDLWAFNEEVVARALFECRTPTVSAVGHEVDTTIADFVADLRAPTPSAAAELVAPERGALVKELERYTVRMHRSVERALQLRRARLGETRRRLGDPRRTLADRRLGLEALRERLEAGTLGPLNRRVRTLAGLRERLRAAHPAERLSRARARLERAAARLASVVRAREHTRRRGLEALRRRLLRAHPGEAIQRERRRLERLETRAIQATLQRSSEARSTLAGLAGKLDALSPLKVLGRGYAVVRTAAG